MSYAASRLTLYAVLSAIEEDLRSQIQIHLGDKPAREVLGEDLYAKCVERLSRDVGTPSAEPPLSLLVIYLDFAPSYSVINSSKAHVPTDLAKYVKKITPKLNKLVPVRNRIAHTRPLDFDDIIITFDTAKEFIAANASLWQELSATLKRLDEDPSFVLSLKIPAYEDDRSNQNHNLPTPDFDETGFLGRKEQIKRLINLCLGPYPVITIVAEGGVGKTAIALKTAYEILDLKKCPFEAVVWTTSKTTQLTPNEIVKIEGAICDSLGVIQNLADQLAGVNAGDALKEVLAYLSEFRILLIIDNLETVLDERIREFLEQLPNGSKILITSRIGLGAFEHPVKLPPMDEVEAVQLLQQLAKVRGVAALSNLPFKELAGYCRRMKNNPGWIKWFVSAIQVGKRPEEVLAKPDLFLSFCMSNVYDYLTEDSRKVLRSMLCLTGRRTQAELSFLNDLPPVRLQRAMQQLLTTNMVNMMSTTVGSSDTTYELSELARSYLSKHHPASSEELKKITRLRHQLTSAGERIRAEQTADPYSPTHIALRSNNDLFVAKYLFDAIKEARRMNFATAETLVDKARELAPSFSETHRIKAFVSLQQNDYSSARNSYEAAVELDPNSAPLRKLYGDFLMKSLGDTEGALGQYEEAFRLDPASFDVQFEMTRACLFLRRFDEAKRFINELMSREDSNVWNRRRVYTLLLHVFQKHAEHLSLTRDSLGALHCLENLKEAFESCPTELLDDHMKERVGRALSTAKQCARFITSEVDRRRAVEVFNWMSLVIENVDSAPVTAEIAIG